MAKKEDSYDPYDLCACYEPEEPVPEEFVEKPEPKKTLENTAHYATDIDGTEYY